MGALRNLICSNRKNDCARPEVVIRCFFFVYILLFPRETPNTILSHLTRHPHIQTGVWVGWGVGEDVASQTYNA